MDEVWEVMNEDESHIVVTVRAGTISNITGTVKFSPDSPLGERCCEDIPTRALGMVGETIVVRLRALLTEPTVHISPFRFRVCLKQPLESERAHALIRDLESRYASKPHAAA